MAAAAAGAVAHVCMHATGTQLWQQSTILNTSNLPGFPADLDLSHKIPSGRMRYDEGSGLILFVDRQQVQAYSPDLSMQQPLWVGGSTGFKYRQQPETSCTSHSHLCYAGCSARRG